MNKSVIFVAIVVLLIGLAVVMFINNSDDKSASDTESDSQVTTHQGSNVNNQTQPEDQSSEAIFADSTVTFTDEGYEPAVITIATGESVAFVNQSDRDNWTASDPHLSHTDLPSFDAGRSYAPGEQYVYTFEEVGKWGYHDHLRSNITGTVIVE